MKFTVIPYGDMIPQSGQDMAFLLADNWDDFFEFCTLHSLIIFDDKGVRHKVGEVKIGQFGMKGDQRSAELPTTFDQLDERFFSL